MDASDGEVIRIVSANLEHGGLSPAGDATRLARTIGALRGWEPHAVLFQEMTARSEPELTVPMWEIPQAERARRVQEMTARAEAKTKEHMERIAGQLGMAPVLRPPTPMSFGRNYPAIFIRSGPSSGPSRPARRRLPPAACIPHGARRW